MVYRSSLSSRSLSSSHTTAQSPSNSSPAPSPSCTMTAAPDLEDVASRARLNAVTPADRPMLTRRWVAEARADDEGRSVRQLRRGRICVGQHDVVSKLKGRSESSGNWLETLEIPRQLATGSSFPLRSPSPHPIQRAAQHAGDLNDVALLTAPIQNSTQ